MNTHDNCIQISDLTLASVISLSFPIIDVDRSNSPRVNFIFNRTPALDELVARFWRKEIQVEPQTLANQIKNLKTRIYSGE